MKRYFIWFVLILVFALRYFTSLPTFSNGQILKLSGYVFSNPSRSASYLKFNLSGLTVFAPPNTKINYMDFVVLEGKYQNSAISVTKVDETKSSNLFFVKIRNFISNTYQNNLPVPYGSLLSAITIGDTSNIPIPIKNQIQNTGISFMLEASGIKISILATIFMNIFLLRFSRNKTATLTIFTIWFYILIAGVEITTFKSGIIISFALLAMIYGRPRQSLRLTFLAALILLIIYPSWIKDLGFILSFSATVSIILFQGTLTKLLIFLPEILRINLATSLAAELLIMPIVFVTLGKINLLTPLIATAIVWMVAPIMIIAFLGIFFHFILIFTYPFLAWFLAVISV